MRSRLYMDSGLENTLKCPENGCFLTKTTVFHGPSGETRTRGILVPNQAPYQLGHTRIFDSSFARSGQTCGQIPFSTAQSGLSVEIFLSAATAFLLSRETQHFPCSSSQTRRPTNWATPGFTAKSFAVNPILAEIERKVKRENAERPAKGACPGMPRDGADDDRKTPELSP